MDPVIDNLLCIDLLTQGKWGKKRYHSKSVMTQNKIHIQPQKIARTMLSSKRKKKVRTDQKAEILLPMHKIDFMRRK